jgi:transposase
VAARSSSGRRKLAKPELCWRDLIAPAPSIRSERLLMERLEYNLLFRWFVGIGVEDAAWDHSVFSKNCHRLLECDVDGSGDPDR